MGNSVHGFCLGRWNTKVRALVCRACQTIGTENTVHRYCTPLTAAHVANLTRIFGGISHES